jgi:hypothetical protein
MLPAIKKSLIVVLAALPSVSVASGKLSWFADPVTDSGAVQTRPSAFGTDVYTSTVDKSGESGFAPNHRVSVFGDYTSGASVVAGDDATARQFANFGVRWQHRLSSIDRVSVSAQKGDGVAPASSTVVGSESPDTRATVSWTRDLLWSWKPSITGGVFLGDESARDESARQFGRRYVGVAVGGELKLLQAHTPYVSFRMERGQYDVPENGTTGNGVAGGGAVDNGTGSSTVRAFDEYSRFAAGWRWQVQRGWSMQAEASFGFNYGTSSDQYLQERERNRWFFGTRFDFR